MRLTEILLSVPNLLLVIFLQAVIGTPSAWSIALVIGLTSWTSIAKVVRTEVQQLRASEYVIAAKCMGGSFSTFCGVTLHRISSRPSSSWW